MTRRVDTTSADGTALVAVDQGQGPPILIVHGGSSQASSWSRVAAALAARFRVLSLERRLYGISGPSRSPHSMAREAEDVRAVAALAGAPVLLVGHSSGAVVALEAALASPEAFTRLVLYEPPVAVTTPLGGEALERARAALIAGDPGRALAIHLREIVRLPRLSFALLRLVPPVWNKLCAFAPAQIADDEAIEAVGVGVDRYADLDLPVLLLGGARSLAHLRRRLEALAGVLPRLDSVVILPRQGHLANQFAPARVARTIQAFADAGLSH
jgi:pimeloyl-ACP methyl ester carboxylesterase